MVSAAGAMIAQLVAVLVTAVVVLVTDYLHLLGLRSPALEHGLIRAYPQVANTIGTLVAFVGLTTLLVIGTQPSVLSDPIFIVWIAIVIIAVINSFFLHHKFFPEFFEEIDAGTMRERTIPRTVLSASVSIASWMSAFVLLTPIGALLGPIGWIAGYVLLISVCFFVALPLEKRSARHAIGTIR